MNDLISRQASIDEIEYEIEMINSALDSITLDFNARERLRQRRGEAREILNSIQQLPSAQPEQRWIPCVDGNEPKANADCWISTNAKHVRRASYAPKASNQPNGFIVTEGGFGFYEYGKSAKAWMPYGVPEPYMEE